MIFYYAANLWNIFDISLKYYDLWKKNDLFVGNMWLAVDLFVDFIQDSGVFL